MGLLENGGPMPDTAPWQQRERFCLLDTAFGQGERFLATWHAWHATPGRCTQIHYVALSETLPPPPSEEFAADWPLKVPGFHRLSLAQGRFQLTLAIGDTDLNLRRIAASCDAIVLGAPLQHAAALARLAHAGTTIRAPFSDVHTRDALSRAGFEINAVTGPAGMNGRFREMRRREPWGASAFSRKSAIVIGAGLAGTAAAASLADRGWAAIVLEREPHVAQGASGNLAGVLSPMLSKDDGAAARLSRASYLFLLRELRGLDKSTHPAVWSACGVLQLARNAKEEALFRDIATTHCYPEEYVRFLSQEEASQDLGHPAAAGGWLFPQGGWVNPPSLCEARLKTRPSIQVRTGEGVLEIERTENEWRVLGAGGRVLGESPVLVLANAYEAARFAPSSALHFKKVRGQVTHLPPDALPKMTRVLSRDGYLTPEVRGKICLGATYDFENDSPSLSPEGHVRNLSRLPELLPGTVCGPLPNSLEGRVGFRSLTSDRMPAVGAIPCAHPGLYGLLGLGSRGLVWSALAGETLAALICGEPSPLPSDLLEAIAPARRAMRTRRAIAGTSMDLDD